MRYSKSICFLITMFILFTNQVFGWDKDIVHTLINKKAVEQSKLDSYLSLQLQSEFPDGISQTISGKSVKTWIEDGGRQEDENILPYIGYLTRSSKHFHDPTKTWNVAGWLNSFQSSIYWAQNTSNEWSWQKAREYYFQALTGTTKNEREGKYGNTFRALGQVMHLIADLAVPEHTRNDTHVIAKTIEGWAQGHSGELNTTAASINNSIFQNSSIQGLVPITNLWDTYSYAGYNPNGQVGLAEYSNYNFLSHDTVFKYYEFPGRTNTFLGEPSTHIAEDGTNDNLIYYSSTASDGIPIPHLAFTKYLFSEISQKTHDELSNLNATLDDNCFKDYASILIPKAVGYSASLINYFFRGKINIDKDPNNGSLYVIKNESDEYMSGTFTLYYDDTTGNRRYLTSWNKSINPNSVSDSVTFTEPTDAKEKGKYILVFQGTMGNETGAVVGRVVELKESGGRVLRYAEVYEGGAWHRKVSVVEVGRETPFFDLNTILQANERLVYRNYRSYLLPIMRFDRSNWNTFVVLIDKGVNFSTAPIAIYNSIANGYTLKHYRVAKFHITTDYTIQYDGDIYTDTSAYYELRSRVIDPHVHCYTGEERREQRESLRYVKIHDIYMISGSLKLVYMVEEKTLDSDTDYTIPVDNEGRCSWAAGAGHSNYRLEVSQTLYFGGIIKTYSYTKIFNYEMFGITHYYGWYEYSDSNGVFISGEDMSNAEFWILNSNEVLYLPPYTYSNGVYAYKYIILPGDSVLKVVTSTSSRQDWKYVFPSDAGFTFSKYADSLPFYNPTVGGYSELLGDKFILLKDLTGFRLTGGNSLCLTKVTIDPALPKGYRLEDISTRFLVGNIVDYALN